MNQPITAKINDKGHLEVGGCDVADLAAEFGTPLYVLDETTLRGKCREYKTAFKKRYDNSLIIFASKALCNTAVARIMCDEGLGLDVSSGGEFYTARKAGCEAKLCYFHGNNKPIKELEDALQAGIGRIVVDNLAELDNLDQVSQKLKKRVDILFRVNPGIEAHTHEFIQTGKIDSKFGIAKDKLIEAVKQAKSTKLVNFVGLHCHIGSQILDIDPFVKALDVLCELSSEVLKQTKERVQEINIGGGLGIDYSGQDKVPKVDDLAEKITSRLKELIKELDLGEPRLILEPGRSIVGNAGITLYRVGSIKEIPGVRKYVAVDGGMNDNPRPILYDAVYAAWLGNRMRDKKEEEVRVVGRFCESGDILIKEIGLPRVRKGDLLTVFCTGAYNFSMASNYNRVGRPAMVLVNNGSATLILKRESYEDLAMNDILPTGGA